MALVFNDRVKETSVTTGTGTLTLDGAVQGFDTFSSAIGNSNTTYYAIELPGTTEFEVGLATISAGQLARTQVISSSNSNSPVDFSAGTKIVFCTLPASKFVPGKFEGSNFTNSLLVGHATTGTLNAAENNTGVGISALDALTTGDSNTAIGTSAGSAVTTGALNVFIGTSAGVGATDMQGCIAIGAAALGSADPGNNNIAIGESAGKNITGVRNLVIGENAGDNITSGSGNVIIGSAVDPSSATDNRQLIIAGNDGSTTTTWISGDNTGALTFADKVVLAANKTIEFGDSGETISGDGTDMTVASSGVLNLNSAAATGPAIKLASSAGGVLVDSSSLIVLDADNADNGIQYKDGATEMLRIHNSSSDVILHTKVQDKDLIFKGNDGGSTITPMMIDMSEGGRVGIFGSGTTVPTAQLHVATDAGGVKLQVTGSSSSVTPGNDADEIFVDNAGNSGVTIGSGTSSKGSIHFGDSGDNDIGMIEYDHSSNSLAFTTDAAERIRVDSSGRVGIGTNSPARDLHVKKSTPGSPVRLEVNNTSNTGASHGVVSIYSGGTSGGDPYLHFKVDSGEQYSIGIDNDQSDALVFSNNFGVGSNNLLSIATDGATTFTDKIILGANKVIEFGDAGETISGDGTDLTIASSNDATIDVAGQINLDASDIGRVHFMHDGTAYGEVLRSSQNFQFKSLISNGDFEIHGNDGGVSINAFKLDMSEAGAATFNDKVILGANKVIEFGDAGETISGDGTNLTIASSSQTIVDSAGNIQLKVGSASGALELDIGGTSIAKFENSSNTVQLRAIVQDKDIEFRGNDGGSQITALSLDMSEAGAATFNDKVILGSNKQLKFHTVGDNIVFDGTNLGITASNALKLDGDQQILLNDGGTNYAAFVYNGSTKFTLHSQRSDVDFAINVNDGGSQLDALIFDASEAGAATFNSSVTVGANLDVSSGTIKLDGDYPTGSNNVALGDTALDSVTSGGQNTAIGSIALTALTTASFNTAIGYKALEDNISGTKNTAIGSNAASNTTGANNVAIGVRTLFFNTSGGKNTAVGEEALLNGTSASQNTALGYQAGASVSGGSNLTILGYQAEPSSGTATNEITLGNASVTSLRIPGLASGASSGDVLTYDGTDITLSAPTGVSAGFAVAMAIAL